MACTQFHKNVNAVNEASEMTPSLPFFLDLSAVATDHLQGLATLIRLL